MSLNLAVTFLWFQQKHKQGTIEKGIHAMCVACIPTPHQREVKLYASSFKYSSYVPQYNSFDSNYICYNQKTKERA